MKKILLCAGVIAGVFLNGCNNSSPQSLSVDATENQQVAVIQNGEAENLTLAGGAKKNTNHTGYTGTGFVDGYINNTTASASFITFAPFTGVYMFKLRYSAGSGTSTNTGLFVNNVKIRNITCPGTGNWNTWAYATEKVTLNAGYNTIMYKAVSSSGACINLDNISHGPVIEVVTPPVEFIACPGTEAYGYFSVVVSSPETLTYRWYRNGSPLSNNGYLVNGATSANLTLYNWSSNWGSISCKITSSSGVVVNTGSVEFGAPANCP